MSIKFLLLNPLDKLNSVIFENILKIIIRIGKNLKSSMKFDSNNINQIPDFFLIKILQYLVFGSFDIHFNDNKILFCVFFYHTSYIFTFNSNFFRSTLNNIRMILVDTGAPILTIWIYSIQIEIDCAFVDPRSGFLIDVNVVISLDF